MLSTLEAEGRTFCFALLRNKWLTFNGEGGWILTTECSRVPLVLVVNIPAF